MYGMDIHGRAEYVDFDFRWSSLDFAKLTVLLSPIYYFPTIFIVGRMFRTYWISYGIHRINGGGNIQKWLFSSFLLMQLGNFFYILTDFIVIRIPATGVLTSSCASTSPNQLLKLPYLIAFISSYVSMLFPVLFCANRAIIVFFPADHNEIGRRVTRVFLPMAVLVPLLLTFFMLPALGHCTQLTAPYPFGAVMFVLDLKAPINEYTHLLTSLFCTVFTFSMNITMLFKVRHILLYKHGRNYKVELSLTITMLSLFTPFLINAIVVILSLRDPSLLGYILAIRPVAIDTATVFVPWAFYLTHPVFRRRRPRAPKSTVSASPVIAITANSSAKSQ